MRRVRVRDGNDQLGDTLQQLLLLPQPLKVQRQERLHERRGVRADALEREAWKAVSAALQRRERLRVGLEKMIELKRALLAINPDEKIARWATEAEKAMAERVRYQDQEAEGLMTREELRTKLAKLDETVKLAETEMDKLRRHEEGLRDLQKGGEELLDATLGSCRKGQRTSPRWRGGTSTSCSGSRYGCHAKETLG